MWFITLSKVTAIMTFLYMVAVAIYIKKNTHVKLKLKYNERYFPWFLKVGVGLLAIFFWTVIPSVMYLLFFG